MIKNNILFSILPIILISGCDQFSRFNYENYGGTPILGLNKSVVIGHGISTDIAIKNMIVLTADVIEADLPSKIKKTFNNE